MQYSNTKVIQVVEKEAWSKRKKMKNGKKMKGRQEEEIGGEKRGMTNWGIE